MEDTTDRIKNVVYEAIDELNELLAEEMKLQKQPETRLIGSEGQLDSVGFINLIVLVEEKYKAHFGSSLSIMDMEEDPAPFESVENLIQHISQIINK